MVARCARRPALVRQQRGVGGKHHDDRAAARRRTIRAWDLGARDLAPDRHAVDHEPLADAVVGLHQGAHRVAAVLLGDQAR